MIVPAVGALIETEVGMAVFLVRETALEIVVFPVASDMSADRLIFPSLNALRSNEVLKVPFEQLVVPTILEFAKILMLLVPLSEQVPEIAKAF